MSTRHRSKHHPAHHPVHPIQSQQQQQQQQTSLHLSHPSDADSDANPAASIPPAPPTRTNGELNLLVLRRHHPSISAILSIAPYAVVYIYAPSSQSWEKSGIEGTLFICRLQSLSTDTSVERYAAVVLNRRGLDPFFVELRSTADVELTTEYIILKDSGSDEENDIASATPDDAGGVGTVYGLWVFAEPAPASTATAREDNARVVQECAARAEQSRAAADAAAAAAAASAVNIGGGEPMGRQLSLRELFGAQRTADESELDLSAAGMGHGGVAAAPPTMRPVLADMAELQAGSPPVLPQAVQKMAPPVLQQQFQPSMDTEFFRSARSPARKAQVSRRPPPTTVNVAAAAPIPNNATPGSDINFLSQMLRASSGIPR